MCANCTGDKSALSLRIGIVLSECSLDLGRRLYVILKIIMEQILEQKIMQNVRKHCGK